MIQRKLTILGHCDLISNFPLVLRLQNNRSRYSLCAASRRIVLVLALFAHETSNYERWIYSNAIPNRPRLCITVFGTIDFEFYESAVTLMPFKAASKSSIKLSLSFGALQMKLFSFKLVSSPISAGILSVLQ